MFLTGKTKKKKKIGFYFTRVLLQWEFGNSNLRKPSPWQRSYLLKLKCRFLQGFTSCRASRYNSSVFPDLCSCTYKTHSLKHWSLLNHLSKHYYSSTYNDGRKCRFSSTQNDAQHKQEVPLFRHREWWPTQTSGLLKRRHLALATNPPFVLPCTSSTTLKKL